MVRLSSPQARTAGVSSGTRNRGRTRRSCKHLRNPLEFCKPSGTTCGIAGRPTARVSTARAPFSVSIHDVDAAKAKMATMAPGQDPSVAPAFAVPAHDPGNGVAWTPDARRVAVIYPWLTHIWDAESGAFLRLASDRESGAPQAWSPDGKILALSMHYGRTLKLWHVGDATPDQLLPTKGLRAIAWSPGGQQLATAEEKQVRIWDVASGKDVQSLPVTAAWHRLAWSPDDQQLALIAEGDKVASLWDVKSGKAVPTKFEGHKSGVNALAWSPDGLLLATGEEAGMIRLSV